MLFRSSTFQVWTSEVGIGNARLLKIQYPRQPSLQGMGIMSAPATFMRTMNNLFSDLLDRGVVAFMDDILIYSSTIKEHELLLKAVFSRLKEK